MQDLIKRVLGVFSVNVTGQIINLALRLISMPLFLHFWGKDLYGEWLIMLTIPSYLAISGSGISGIAANEMVIKSSKGLQAESLSVFQSVWAFISSITLLFVLLTALFAFIFPVAQWLKISHISVSDIRICMVLLAFYTFCLLQGELLLGAFRVGKFVKGVLWYNLINLFENVGLLVVVAYSSNVLIALGVYVAIRLLGTCLMAQQLFQQVPWLKFGVRHASLTVIKSSIIPAFSFFGINISNALSVQGVLMVIGLRLGAPAVVVFTAIRTIVNLIKQFNSMIYYSVLPEFSTSLAKNNILLARKLHRYACQISLYFTLFNIIILMFLGKTVIHIWTNGKLEVDYLFFLLMLFSMLPNTFYVTSAYVHVSINKLTKISIVCLLASIFSIVLTYVTIPFIGIAAAPVAQIVCDTILLLIIVHDSLLLLNDTVSDFIQSMFRFDYLKKIRHFRRSVFQS
jgi:O-antigen/teichoic acid export membrane protein